MAAERPDSDTISVFAYYEADSETFSLSQLNDAVGDYFGTACTLVKMEEGGYHKVPA